MAPLIGITTTGRYEFKLESRYYDDYFASPTPYVDAVRRAGGVPLLLPPGGDDWRAAVSAVDAVIVTGGMDINPTCYGGNPDHPQLTVHDPERDATELGLLRYLAHEADKPVLCICRGMQILNVALGGTMHEHIPDIRPQDIHRDTNGWWTRHDVHVQAGSRLREVMQADTVNTYSGHHQAVKDLAPGLQVTATAPDGIIEALALPEHPWLVAVQWHPEISAHEDHTQQRLFDGLVQAAHKVLA